MLTSDKTMQCQGVTYKPKFLSPDRAKQIFQQCKKMPFMARSTIVDKKPNGRTVYRGPLTFRGNELPRSKVFLTEEGKMLIYNYTGFQYETVEFYQAIEDYKQLAALKECVEKETGQKFNHIIVTKYDAEGDCIDWHTDKDKDFKDDSGFAVVTLGDARPFQIRPKPASAGQNPPVCWEEKMPSGSLLFVSYEANQKNQHRVVRSDSKNARISIVFRNIGTLLKPEEYEKKKKIWTKRNLKRKLDRERVRSSKALPKQDKDKEEVHSDSGEETETDDYTKDLREREEGGQLSREDEPVATEQQDDINHPPKRAKLSVANGLGISAKGRGFK